MVIVIIATGFKGVSPVGGGGEVSLCHFSQDRLTAGYLQFVVTGFVG